MIGSLFAGTDQAPGRIIKRGGKLFIEYAQQLIKKPNFNFKIIQLESIRFFLKKSPKKDYSMIAKHIEELFL